MRKLLTILLLFTSAFAFAGKGYYIANAGNDNAAGTQAAPFLTITKMNSITMADGDSILFKCGDRFTGSLLIRNNNIYVGAYSSGAKPILSGFTTLTSWTNVGTNLWECTPSPALKNNCNILTINDVPQAVGRTPNTGYYVYQSATTSTLTSSSLTGSYVGAEAVIKKNSYVGEKVSITSQSGTTITYTTNQPIDNNLVVGPTKGTDLYGYFLQRYEGSLDVQGEWFNNTATKRVRLYSTANPSTFNIKASYVDTIINIAQSKNNITITNLAIEGGGMYGVEKYLGSSLTVTNCSFNNNTKAIYVWNCNNTNIDNNTINNSFNGAILVSNNQAKGINVTNNNITNTGQLMGMGLFWSNYNLKGIIARVGADPAGNYVNVTGNRVINTGHAGIEFQGSNVVIARNLVDTFCTKLDDNGGIYTFVNNLTVNTTNYVNRRVDSNFILNGLGAPDGSKNATDVAAMYFDDQSLNLTANHNTIANTPGNGAQLNNSVNISLIDNTIYNTGSDPQTGLLSVNKKPFSNVSGVIIKHNILYTKTNTQLNFFHGNSNITLPSPGMTIAQSLTNQWNMDSNYISNQASNSYGYFYNTGSKDTFPPNFNLTKWQNTYLHDVHSVLPGLTLTPTNTTIYYNYADTVRHLSFNGLRKQDPAGNIYDNAANIPRYSSLILIENGNSPAANIPPHAVIAPVADITLPTSQVTLTSNSTDADGTISSYAWSKVSGPGSATIVNPTLISTAVTGLPQGTHQYQLIVTDNGGLKDTARVIFVVNAAIPPPNVLPTVTASPTDTTIQLPANTVAATGHALDSDGTIVSHKWTKLLGGTATITNPNDSTTQFTGLVEGSYTFRDSVTDNSGGTAAATVKVTVLAALANTIPVAKAGTGSNITLPKDSATLNGSASMATTTGATITTFHWVKLSGTGGTIASPDSAVTVVNGLAVGEYEYELTVTDSNGLTATDKVKVIVIEAPVPNNGPFILYRVIAR